MNFIQTGYKGRNDWWRHLISHLVLMFPFLLNVLLIIAVPDLVDQAYENMKDFDGNKNIFLVTNLLPFVFLLGFLFLLVKFLHERSITSVITSRKKVDWRRFFFGFFFWGTLTVVMIVISYFMEPEMYVWNFKPSSFFTLLIVALIFIPLQTSFEELYFRGFLIQSTGILFKNKWFPLIFTSVLFGTMHAFNPEIEKIGYSLMIYYIGTGFLFGIVTLLDEGTEIALGMHAVNNIIAATLITSDWTVFQTDALLIDKTEPNLGLIMYLPVFVIYPLTIFIFSKKYGWTNWKDKLFGKAENPIKTNELDELGS